MDVSFVCFICLGCFLTTAVQLTKIYLQNIDVYTDHNKGQDNTVIYNIGSNYKLSNCTPTEKVMYLVPPLHSFMSTSVIWRLLTRWHLCSLDINRWGCFHPLRLFAGDVLSFCAPCWSSVSGGGLHVLTRSCGSSLGSCACLSVCGGSCSGLGRPCKGSLSGWSEVSGMCRRGQRRQGGDRGGGGREWNGGLCRCLRRITTRDAA